MVWTISSGKEVENVRCDQKPLSAWPSPTHTCPSHTPSPTSIPYPKLPWVCTAWGKTLELGGGGDVGGKSKVWVLEWWRYQPRSSSKEDLVTM